MERTITASLKLPKGKSEYLVVQGQLRGVGEGLWRASIIRHNLHNCIFLIRNDQHRLTSYIKFYMIFSTRRNFMEFSPDGKAVRLLPIFNTYDRNMSI